MAGLFPIGTNISEGPAPLTVQFTRPGNSGPSYTWTFGDGASSHDQNPVHTFQHPGVYDVSLQTWELIGETMYENEFFSTTITVTEPNPVVITIGLISPETSVNVVQILPSGSLMIAMRRK